MERPGWWGGRLKVDAGGSSELTREGFEMWLYRSVDSWQLTVDSWPHAGRPLPGRKRIGVMNSLVLISPDRAWGFIWFPVAWEWYRGHGSAVSLPELIVGTRHCRVLTVGNNNSHATGVDIKPILSGKGDKCDRHSTREKLNVPAHSMQVKCPTA
jgi:hypothetical protein